MLKRIERNLIFCQQVAPESHVLSGKLTRILLDGLKSDADVDPDTV